jgi:hypothetical protein
MFGALTKPRTTRSSRSAFPGVFDRYDIGVGQQHERRPVTRPVEARDQVLSDLWVRSGSVSRARVGEVGLEQRCRRGLVAPAG